MLSSILLPASLSHASSSAEDISSNSLRTVPHVSIQKAPTETLDLDLDSIIHHMFHLLKFINKNDIFSDQCSTSNSAKTIDWRLLKEISHAHSVTAGLLVLLNILRRFETVLAHGSEWFDLLEEINGLFKYLRHPTERSGLKKMMENKLREAILLIVKASLMFTPALKLTLLNLPGTFRLPYLERHLINLDLNMQLELRSF